MVSAHRKALERLWQDRCDIYGQREVTNPVTCLTDFVEAPLFLDQPCRLSFGTSPPAGGGPLPAVEQSIKLFLSPETEVPAGSRVVVTRPGLERSFFYFRSGEAQVYSDHQEIRLVMEGRG